MVFKALRPDERVTRRVSTEGKKRSGDISRVKIRRNQHRTLRRSSPKERSKRADSNFQAAS